MLNSLLTNRLRKTLLKLHCFNSDKDLKAVFLDTRLSLWKDDITQADTLRQRVAYFIEHFEDKWNDANQNALWLFLYTLCDTGDIVGQSTKEIKNLARDIIVEKIQIRIEECKEELEDIRIFKKESKEIKAKEYAIRREKALREDLQIWEEKLNLYLSDQTSIKENALTSSPKNSPINRTNKETFDDPFSNTYLNYISHTLLAGMGLKNIDPFSVEIPDSKLNSAYVSRGSVHEHDSCNRVIVAKTGNGKTSLAQKSNSLSNNMLTIVIPLSEARLSLGPPKKNESVLNISLIIKKVCEKYFREIFYNRSNYTRFFKFLRKDKLWLKKLRWFYYHYSPIDIQFLDEDPLIKSWLEGKVDKWLYPDASPYILEALIHFITTFNSLRVSTNIPFTHAQIFIDGAEILPNSLLSQLLIDFEKLLYLAIPNLSLVLLLDEAQKRLLYELISIQQKHLIIEDLPEWKDKDLRLLLAKRLKAWRTNEFIRNEKELVEWNWIDLVPNIDLGVKYHIIDWIVSEALSIGKKDTIDAPIHTLKLTRNIIAACAENSKLNKPVLDKTTVKTIIESYRLSVLEKKK